MLRHNQSWDFNYFLGEVSRQGWFYYFPIVMVVKSPTPFLILAAIGIMTVIRGDWRKWAIFLTIPSILAAGLFSRVNIGVRHVMPVFCALAALGAFGTALLWKKGRIGRTSALALLLWFCVDSALAHPDYLAYFNELVDGRSGEFGVDTDLDYGQDLKRLAGECQRLGVHSLWLAYHGSASPDVVGLPAYRILPPGPPVTGWVAISMFKLKVGEIGAPGAYAWLEELKPTRIVGQSIRMYYNPPRP